MPAVVFNTTYGGFGISLLCARFMADHGHGKAMEMLKDFEDEEYWSGDIDSYNIPRHVPLLVLAWTTLGPIKTSHDNSELDICELAGNKYFIKEYDGIETVVEPKDINWTYIDT